LTEIIQVNKSCYGNPHISYKYYAYFIVSQILLRRKIIPEGLNYQVRDVEREITETLL